FAHAASTQALDRLKALEARQPAVGSGRRRGQRRLAVEFGRDGKVAADETLQRFDELRAVAAEIHCAQHAAAKDVFLHEPTEGRLETGGPLAHKPVDPPSFSVSAAIARANSIRQASSDLPSRWPISGNDRSSNFLSRMICRCASLSDSIAASI